MKKWLLIVFCMVAVASYGQIPTGLPTQFSNQWYRFSRYMTVDSLFGLPYRDTNFVAFRAGVLVTRPADSLVYRSTGKTSGKKWDLAGTGGTFGVYTAGNGLALSGTTFRVDTSVIAARARLQKVADSLGAIISGTVPTSTSVSTSYGLEGGGTLTTSLSLEADTTQLSTRAWRKKGTDSVAALLSNYATTSRNITTGFGLTGGGNLTTDRTLVADTANSLASRLRVIKVIDSLKFASNTWSAKQTFTDSIVGVNQRLSGTLGVSGATSILNSLSVLSSDGVMGARVFAPINFGTQVNIDLDQPNQRVLIGNGNLSASVGFGVGGGGGEGLNVYAKGWANILNSSSVSLAYIDGTGVTSTAFIKTGGTSSQILAANGSVITAGTGITISGGSISASVVDTVTLSTRAWRQKGVDSLLSVFNTRVSGTTNTIAMFTASGTVGNSALTQTSTTLSVPRQLNIALPTDTSIVGTLVGTGVNVGSQWVFKNDYNTRGGFVGIAAGETTGDMVLAVGDNKKIVFGLGTVGNSRAAEFSENAFKIFQTAGSTSNWVTLGSLTGTQTWLFGSATTGSGFTLKTDAYINVTINGTAYKLALVN
jgi:hypothetical protein